VFVGFVVGQARGDCASVASAVTSAQNDG
jgi:hypothetical protein